MARRSQQGFTLIEILVAFMILALSLTVAFRIFSTGLRNVALSGDYARAVLVAEAQLAVPGVSEPLEPGVTSGAWGRRFRWERVVEPYRPWVQEKELSAPLQAFQVTVNVDWEQAGRIRQVSLSSVRLKPVQPTGSSG